MEKFTIEFGGEAELTEAEIWPDGDMPVDPTVQDVICQIVKNGNIFDLIRNWNLSDAILIEISHLSRETQEVRWL